MDSILILAALFLAFGNGANDNFKGFATVWGSATLNYRQALTLATLATLAGSLASLLLANELVQHFSGKGLVADTVVNAPLFILSVASAAALTIALATWLGMPVSTTHALIGGLIGAGLAHPAADLHIEQLLKVFLLPLLISPLVAAGLGRVAGLLQRLRPARHGSSADCVCVVSESTMMAATEVMLTTHAAGVPTSTGVPSWLRDTPEACARLATPVRFSLSRNLDRLHIVSAMAICFARGVNDTPKLVALLLTARLFNSQSAVVVIALVMAAGGVMFAGKVARTMSQRVTRMDHSQGLAANLITATLVLFASKFGLPVSTTHVSVGAIAGVGASASTLNWPVLRSVLLSWLATLPLAAALAWLVFMLSQSN